MFTAVKCVTLDLDNTLWPIEPTIRLAEEKLYQWMQSSYPGVAQKYSSAEIRLAHVRDLIKTEDNQFLLVLMNLTIRRYLQMKDWPYSDDTVTRSIPILLLNRRFLHSKNISS